MTDNTFSENPVPCPTGNILGDIMDRRVFIGGLGAAALGAATVASSPFSPASAALNLTRTSGPAGLVSIAGRITNDAGHPEKRAYVEIHHHRVREWTPGTGAGNIHVDAWEAPDWFGVWTDDDGVFGLHTWWSTEGPEGGDNVSTPTRAQVLFRIETASGARLARTLWLEPNPDHLGHDPEDPSTLTPVAWADRSLAAQYVADFTVG